MPLPSLSLVIPAFDAASLLDASLERAWRWLEGLDRAVELVVVDDGSRDATPAILARFASRARAMGRGRFRALRNPMNRGKGYAVRRGVLAARGHVRLFVDAGLTYPVEALARVTETLDRGADVAIASRLHPESLYLVPPGRLYPLVRRHLVGRLHNRVARAIAVPGILDTQAGLKGFRAAAAERVFGVARLDRFTFDVETLFLARRFGFQIAEVPVRYVDLAERTTLRPFRDGLCGLGDLIRIRALARAGAYERRAPRGTSPQRALAPEDGRRSLSR